MLNNEETILNKDDYRVLDDSCNQYNTISLSYVVIPLNFVLFYLIWKNQWNNEYLLVNFYNIIWELMRICSIIYIWSNNNVFQPIYIYLYDNYKIVSNKFNYVNHYTNVRDGREIIEFNEEKDIDEITYCAINYNSFNDDIVYYTNYNYIYYSDLHTSPDNMDQYIERVKKHIETSKIINNENNFKNVKLYFISCIINLKIKNDDPINIDVDLRRFMVAGNKILNKNFVLWHCNKFNGIDPDAIESYEINIIDCDVDTIKLTVGDYIEIRGSEYLIHKQFNLKNNTPINDLDKILENYTDDDISNGANYGED